jgi:restriction system protein
MAQRTQLSDGSTWEERTTYTARGLPRTEIVVKHQHLGMVRVIRDASRYVAAEKAAAQIQAWDKKWRGQRYMIESEVGAARRTEEAQAALNALQGILHSSLGVDHRVDWPELEHAFPDAKPREPEYLAEPTRPDRRKGADEEPVLGKGKYHPSWCASFMDHILARRWRQREQEARERFDRDHSRWEETVADLESRYTATLKDWEAKCQQTREENQRRREQWEKEASAWEDRKRLHETDEKARVDAFKQDVASAKRSAVEEFLSIALERSDYPDYFPCEFAVAFNPETKILVCDLQLPSPGALPTLKEVVYVKTKGKLSEKQLSKKDSEALYDAVAYQICLRTIHEIFSADEFEALDLVTFNGWVREIDRGTGKDINPCILSLQVTREEFAGIDLTRVDPKACFRALKGVGSTKLHALAPVAPLLQLDTEDDRFVAGRSVADGVTEGTNLAAMDWEDFEHLIRQIFEAEFSEAGAEVKITQTSRDRGVDAVVFDPRPIYGGKTVLQAKRYTNTVGVDAVRDLYGTVINEGANKGILVTTSDFGPEAHKFAADKPIELLSGGNFLHLLAKHGHRARIDLREAKKLLADKETEPRV